MNFVNAVKSAYTHYVDFNGRASRSEYWFFVLFLVIVYVILAVLIIQGIHGAALVYNLFALANLLPHLGLGARRLHDVGRSGWWLLLPFTIIGVFVLLYWFCCKGTNGSNAFGNDPLAK